MRKFIVIILCCLVLNGCSNNENKEDGLISSLEAKEMIINQGAILLDVRTVAEYEESHISGASLIALDDISEETVAEVVSDKDTIIIVYCQSGKRSHQALEKLEALGYTAVYDLGAMENWEE